MKEQNEAELDDYVQMIERIVSKHNYNHSNSAQNQKHQEEEIKREEEFQSQFSNSMSLETATFNLSADSAQDLE